MQLNESTAKKNAYPKPNNNKQITTTTTLTSHKKEFVVEYTYMVPNITKNIQHRLSPQEIQVTNEDIIFA